MVTNTGAVEAAVIWGEWVESQEERAPNSKITEIKIPEKEVVLPNAA